MKTTKLEVASKTGDVSEPQSYELTKKELELINGVDTEIQRLLHQKDGMLKFIAHLNGITGNLRYEPGRLIEVK